MKFKLWIFVIIVLFALVTRFVNLGNPPNYYFDEVYHGVTAKAYARNDPAGYEWWHPAPESGTAYEWLHPPVAKLLMAVGYKYLGETAWAWRVPGAITGVLVVLAVYWLAWLLSKNRNLALLAMAVASLDGLLLSMSRIGMNDIYVTLFMLLAVGTYWKSRSVHGLANKWLLMSGVLTGLAISTKWSGIFVLPMIGIWEIVNLLHLKWQWFKRLPVLIVLYGLVPVMIYFGSYGQFWLQGHTWAQFKELHQQIWWYQTNLEATHTFQSEAWEWPLMLRPVWFYVKYLDSGKVANIYNLSNPFISWLGLAAVGWLLTILVVRKRLVFPALVITVAYGCSWMWWLFSPRIMFFYHYTPAMPWLAIALAFGIRQLWKNSRLKIVGAGIFGIIALTFFWLSPLWLGWPVPANVLPYLFWLSSWK